MKASIVENVSLGKPGSIDREHHVIRGVKILGFESANGRTYPRAVMERALSQYEGRRVYVDHVSPDNPKRSRSYTEQMGVIRAPRMAENGMVGDFHYNPKHPTSEQMLYDAEHNPDLLGFSHHADIDQKKSGNRMTVESIYRVRSVDLVCEPATNNGLFESKESEPMTKTLKETIEAAGAGKLKVLEDMMSGGAMAPDMPVEAADGGDSDSQIKAAFRSAIVAAFEDSALDSKATIAKIKTLVQAYDKVSGDAGGAGGGGGGAGDKTESKTEAADDPQALKAENEKLRRENEVRKLAVAEGVQLTDVVLKAAVALESAEDRAALVKGLPKPAVEKKGPPKPGTSGSVTEAAGEGGAAPAKPFEKPADVRSFMRTGR